MRAISTAMMLAACGAASSATLQFDGAAERFLPGVVSRDDKQELQATVHPVEQVVVFGCTDCGRREDTDLFTALGQNGAWGRSGRSPVSRHSNESLPSFSSDGYWLYYVDDRKRGFGGKDLMRAYFTPYSGLFSPPELLQGTINSAGDEGGAAADAHGATVVFASQGRKGAKGWDLFVSRRVGGKMSEAVRLDALDTAADEFDPALLANDAGLVFARAQAIDGTPASLWFAPRQGDGFGKPVRLGEAVNAPGSSVRGPQEDWRAPGHLLFTRDGDIFRIAYRVAP